MVRLGRIELTESGCEIRDLGGYESDPLLSLSESSNCGSAGIFAPDGQVPHEYAPTPYAPKYADVEAVTGNAVILG